LEAAGQVGIRYGQIGILAPSALRRGSRGAPQTYFGTNGDFRQGRRSAGGNFNAAKQQFARGNPALAVRFREQPAPVRRWLGRYQFI
jgi:hypothetical protein